MRTHFDRVRLSSIVVSDRRHNRLLRSLELLFALGLLDAQCRLTRRGRRAAMLPVAPPLATALVRAHSFGARAEVISIAAMLSVEEVIAMM